MKKMFLSFGSIAGAALSLLTLASCGSNQTTIKDMNGNDVTIKASNNADDVSKATLAIMNSYSTNECRPYAVELSEDASTKANLDIGYYNSNTKQSASFNVRASIGTNTYTTLTSVEEGNTTDYEANALKELKDNIKFEFDVNFDYEMENKIDEAKLQEILSTVDNVELYEPIYRAAELSINNKIEAKGFLEDGNLYTEATTVDSVATSTTTSTKNEYNVLNDVFSLYHYSSYSTLTSILNDYQTNVFNINDLLSITTTEQSNIYDTEIYTSVKDFVSKYSIEISEVKNDVVTFKMDVTGKFINEIVGNFLSSIYTTLQQFSVLNSILDEDIVDEDMVYSTISLSLNAKTGFPTAFSEVVNSDSYKNYIISGSEIKYNEMNAEVNLNFKYNDDVKFGYTKDSSKKYEEITSLISPIETLR